ncbi:hypothetical protein B0T11DRAFT_116659 [Plectosphaerella cucumerina]|uniref:Uncharacterized protein n=1 Tax=Plectosphaerella cucumerina TaxID=40658 RepID=A0A8K0WZT3_9PEZI|nr:hypothetical protein B0T11DRAFT_116659 [Plectosphaerella cucumerina]
MFQRSLLALAGASAAIAAPAVSERQIPGAAVPDVGGLPGLGDVPAVSGLPDLPEVSGLPDVGAGEPVTGQVGDVATALLPTLLAQILTSVETLGLLTDDLTETDLATIETIEQTISVILQGVDLPATPTDPATPALPSDSALPEIPVLRRQIDLDIIGDLLDSLGLGESLGLVSMKDLNTEETQLLQEASDIVVGLAQELQPEVTNAVIGRDVKVDRRQLDIITSLPIVGPLLDSLLGGGLGGVGLGGLGAVTGGLGGLTGGLGGLTGTVGGLTGGLTGGSRKIKVEDVKVSDVQLDLARKAEALFEKVGELLKKDKAH